MLYFFPVNTGVFLYSQAKNTDCNTMNTFYMYLQGNLQENLQTLYLQEDSCKCSKNVFYSIHFKKLLKFFLYLQDPVITEPCIFIGLGSGNVLFIWAVMFSGKTSNMGSYLSV
jgi:hypothetical protein